MEDFTSRLSRAASNDPALVQLSISRWERDIPENRAELVQRVVAALATNTHVKSLKFYDLQLTEADIAPLAELLKTRDFEELDLERNQLTGQILFPALAVRDSLRVLRLSYNESLTAFEHLSALNSLKELDLSSCGLSAASLALLQMPNLEVLDLSSNPLKTLPDSFASLLNFKHCGVSGCEFSEFPAVLLSLTQLQNLDISVNQLTSIPDGIAGLVNLKVFAAGNCGLKEFPIAMTQLVRLEELDLSLNSDITRVPDDIRNLRRLKVLCFSHCGLTELPGALWTLAHLEALDLGSNPLPSVPGGIGALSRLKKLNMNFCPIIKLPSAMEQLSLLEVLDISSTEVTHLPVWLASLRSLKHLGCFDCSLVGVSMADNTLVKFGQLAALMSNSSDPEEVGKLKESFKEMIRKEPLHLLQIANKHFAPKTLRALCVSKCVAQHSRVDVARLPSHIRDEIALAAQRQEKGILETRPAPAEAVQENTQKRGCFVS